MIGVIDDVDDSPVPDPNPIREVAKFYGAPGAGAIGGLLALLAAGLVAVAIVWGRRVKEQ